VRQRSRVDSCEQPCCNGFCIALDSRKLPGEHQPRSFLQPQVFVEQYRRLNIRVAMNLPVAQEARILKARNQPQHAGLLAKLEMF